MTRRVALAFLAHPDDAEILCAGTLIRLRDAGWDVHIATVTSGDCGTMDRSPAEISAIRRREAAGSATLVGGTYHCLDERDGFVVYDKPTIRKALDLFRQIAPTLVFAHAPADYMMDHEEASKLARGASFLYGAPNASRIRGSRARASPPLLRPGRGPRPGARQAHDVRRHLRADGHEDLHARGTRELTDRLRAPWDGRDIDACDVTQHRERPACYSRKVRRTGAMRIRADDLLKQGT